MKPIYSFEDRCKIVMNFIALRGAGKVPIHDFSSLSSYLSEITPLRPMKKTIDIEDYTDSISGFSGHVSNPSAMQKPLFARLDAEEYFNWLIYMLTADDKATDEQRKEAVNQLFLFIFVLRDKIRVNLNDFLKARFDWERKVITLKNALKDLKSNVEDNNEQNESEHADLSDKLKKETEVIADTFEIIGNWQKRYQPLLEKLEREKQKIDDALKGDNIGKKRNP